MTLEVQRMAKRGTLIRAYGYEDSFTRESCILPMGCSRCIDFDENDGKGSSIIMKVNMGECSG